MTTPFSINDVINSTQSVVLKVPCFFYASDGVPLAYYSFVPENPKAVLIFYHGGGIWSNKLYHAMAYELCNSYSIAVYLVDIRGHGNSQGPRGDSPSTEQVWNDITSAIHCFKQFYPNLSMFLGGHSSGAGLVLNYSSWKSAKEVEGYIFLAPFLGPNSDAIKNHDRKTQKFIKKVRLWVLILHALSGGKWFNHSPAIFFNYSDSLKQHDPFILSYYTCTMSRAVTPQNATLVFQNLTKPCALYCGAYDEQFWGEKIVGYTEHLPPIIREKSIGKIIQEATHLSLVLEAPSHINAFVEKMLKI